MLQKNNESTSDSGIERNWWKKMWSLKIPSKVKQFIWRAHNYCIATMLNLYRRHVVTNGLCPDCKKKQESTNHALFRCDRAKRFWRLIHHNINIRQFNYESIQDRFLDVYQSVQQDMLVWICMGAWAMWNDHNAVVHGKPIPNATERCEWLARCIAEFQKENVIPTSRANNKFFIIEIVGVQIK